MRNCQRSRVLYLTLSAMQFEIVVFTASKQVYADRVIDYLDPQGTLVQHRVYRDHCVEWQCNYLKDLAVLGRDLARTAIVDNSPLAFSLRTFVFLLARYGS